MMYLKKHSKHWCKNPLLSVFSPNHSKVSLTSCVSSGWSSEAHPAAWCADAGSEVKAEGPLHHILHCLLQPGQRNLDHLQRKQRQERQGMSIYLCTYTAGWHWVPKLRLVLQLGWTKNTSCQQFQSNSVQYNMIQFGNMVCCTKLQHNNQLEPVNPSYSVYVALF